MADSLEKTAAPWEAIADMWNTVFAPPSRIYPGELVKYKEWLQQLNPEVQPLRALMLGATPELRDILTELGYKVTIIDINEGMILAMNSLVKFEEPAPETVIGNWLESPFETELFDVIVGDAVLPNVMWEDRAKLLKEVHRMLKPEGSFVTRAFLVKKRFKDLNEVLEDFKGKQPSAAASIEFVVELQALAYKEEDHLGTFTKPREILETLRTETGFDTGDEQLNKLLEIVWDVWCTKFIKKVFTYAFKATEEAQYKQFFTIETSFQSDDSRYCDITPMYILKKSS